MQTKSNRIMLKETSIFNSSENDRPSIGQYFYTKYKFKVRKRVLPGT